MGDFEVRASRENGRATLLVGGELDIFTAPRLEQAILEAERGEPNTLLLDFGEVEFMDSTGLRSLLAARRRAQSEGRELLLRNLRPEVGRVFEVTGTASLFVAAR